jgi:hypothetical protein
MGNELVLFSPLDRPRIESMRIKNVKIERDTIRLQTGMYLRRDQCDRLICNQFWKTGRDLTTTDMV